MEGNQDHQEETMDDVTKEEKLVNAAFVGSPTPPYPSAYPPPESAYPPPQNAYPPPQGAYPPPHQEAFQQGAYGGGYEQAGYAVQQGGYEQQGGYAPQGFVPQGYPTQYPPQGNPYGGQPAGAAVIAGMTQSGSDFYDEFAPIVAPFSEQLRKLPSHFLHALRPHLSTYQQLIRHATWSMTFFLFFFYILWGMVTSALSAVVANHENPKITEENNVKVEVRELSVGSAVLVSFLVGVIGFFFLNGTFHLVALCFSGNQSRKTSSRRFLELCFISLIFGFPLALLRIFTLIPYLGSLISIALFIFAIVVLVISLRAIYNISTGQAIGVIILYAVVMIIIAFVLLFAFSFTLVGVLAILSAV